MFVFRYFFLSVLRSLFMYVVRYSLFIYVCSFATAFVIYVARPFISSCCCFFNMYYVSPLYVFALLLRYLCLSLCSYLVVRYLFVYVFMYLVRWLFLFPLLYLFRYFFRNVWFDFCVLYFVASMCFFR